MLLHVECRLGKSGGHGHTCGALPCMSSYDVKDISCSPKQGGGGGRVTIRRGSDGHEGSTFLIETKIEVVSGGEMLV